MRNHTHGIKGFLSRHSVWLKVEKQAYKFFLTENMLPHKEVMKDL